MWFIFSGCIQWQFAVQNLLCFLESSSPGAAGLPSTAMETAVRLVWWPLVRRVLKELAGGSGGIVLPVGLTSHAGTRHGLPI